MARRILALCLVVGLTSPHQTSGAQSSPADADLATGIRQVREGDFEAALITLDGVVRRLAAQKGQANDLARAYTYLAIAYVGLAQQETAKAKFLEAWKADKHMTLSPKEFPPNIIEFFEQAKKEGEEKAGAEAKATPTTPRPTPTPVTTTEKAEKKGGAGGKTALIVVGVLAAAGGIALAAKGGSSSPPPTTLPRCTTGPDFTFVVDVAFTGAFNCGTSNPRTQTYKIINRSCSSLTVQKLVMNRGLTAGTCNLKPSEELSLNGTTVVPAAAGAPATAIIRTGPAAGTAHYLCCGTYPCTVGGCSLNEGYTVTTTAGAQTVANTLTVNDTTGRDCVPCSGAVGPQSGRQAQASDGHSSSCAEPY